MTRITVLTNSFLESAPEVSAHGSPSPLAATSAPRFQCRTGSLPVRPPGSRTDAIDAGREFVNTRTGFLIVSGRFVWPLLSVGRRPVDPRDLTAHRAQVGAELAAMVDRMLDCHRQKVDSGRLDHTEQIDDAG